VVSVRVASELFERCEGKLMPKQSCQRHVEKKAGIIECARISRLVRIQPIVQNTGTIIL